jgi:hypothetical protein
MSGSNSWAEFAGLFRSTRQAFLEHERPKTELKAIRRIITASLVTVPAV